ncbi:TwdlZ, partial [Drosophila busckii]
NLVLTAWTLLSLTSALSLPSRYYLPPRQAASDAAPPIITKQFYTITAAEEPEELQPRTKHLVIGRASTNYRVIFIRAPSSQSDQLRYTAELAPQEERTVIYVLSRKQHELQAQDIQTPSQQQQQQSLSKPDVFFIKYKTNDEAAAAQREIQTQYDQLGGNTEFVAPYVAPAQSVVGSLDA